MAIQFLRGTKSKVTASTKVLSDGQPLYEKDTHKLKVGDGSTEAKSLPYVKVDTDSELSSTSTNPVQNKVINTELEGKVSKAGDTMTGNLVISKDSNPWVGLYLGEDRAYMQVFSSNNISRLTMGFGSSKSIGVDANGNAFIPSTAYGTTLPSSPATNQLFFQTVETNFVLDNVYPVGSIYMNVNSTNPGTLFGGTWEQIHGKFLLGMSSSYPAGSSGGEAKHTLTANEMPVHSHVAFYGDDGAIDDYLGGSTADYGLKRASYGSGKSTYETSSAGGGAAHNNMPPYLSVYIWKRTA